MFCSKKGEITIAERNELSVKKVKTEKDYRIGAQNTIIHIGK